MTGVVDYNVTFQHLGQLLEEKGFHLADQKGKRSAFEFSGPQGIMGAIYPRPGGLKACLELEAPSLNVISSEGTGHIYQELAQYPAVGAATFRTYSTCSPAGGAAEAAQPSELRFPSTE